MKLSEDISGLVNTVRHNCDISDSNGASIFSICGMALRLRDMNKWRTGLPAWQEDDPAALLDWIDKKEQIWEKLTDKPFTPLPLAGQKFDPFDTLAANRILASSGLFYGAGYAHSLKPTFFLARILDSYTQNGIAVKVLGEELARDLLTLPALNQDSTVVLRQDAARLFLWDQMAYIKKSGLRFLKFALRECGMSETGVDARRAHFETILTVQSRTYLTHEIGEIKETFFDGQVFRQIVSSFPHSPVELLARTLRDLLCDTGDHGPLARMIKDQDAAGLGFYAAFQDGLFRPLSPQLRLAVEKFVSDRDWNGIAAAKEKGLQTARSHTQALLEIYETAKKENTLDKAADIISKQLVQPLID